EVLLWHFHKYLLSIKVSWKELKDEEKLPVLFKWICQKFLDDWGSPYQMLFVFFLKLQITIPLTDLRVLKIIEENLLTTAKSEE
ncbi:MAG: hypothetical protein ACQUYJ_12005, partial [Ferruginibacter sp.]